MNYIHGDSAYVILINDDNTMTVTRKKRLVQRSKLVDDLLFLVKPEYNGYNMADFTVVLEYLLPVSNKYRNEFLSLSQETYNDYLMYTLPVDTKLTAEAGKIEIKISFIYSDLSESGTSVQRVRKITSTMIEIVPNSAWSDIIPDCALGALDQRIIKLDAQLKAFNEAHSIAIDSKADDIFYDENTNEMQLLSGDKPVGKKIVIKHEMDPDGVPVVDFSKISTTPDSDEDDDDDFNNVVEF